MRKREGGRLSRLISYFGAGLAKEIPAAAARIADSKRRVIRVANSPRDPTEELSEVVRQSVREGGFRR